MQSYDRLVFVDYDGTVTMQDTVVKSLNLFMDPEEAMSIANELHSGEITLRRAVHRCFDGQDQRLIPKMLSNIKNVRIRPGFEEFLERMEELEIPVILLSAGFEPLIMYKIGHLQNMFLDMYYGRIEVEDGCIKIVGKYDDGVELINKQHVMSQYQSDMKIAIGDGLTDIGMATDADLTFARGQLMDMMDERGLEYIHWDDFFDIIKVIENL